MFKNIVFVGGIHGVGKGHFCQKIRLGVGFEYLSASEVINWSKIKENPHDKRVDDIKHTQELLIEGLKARVEAKKQYLLDGHFCLFNAEGKINKVPKETFRKIAPRLLITVTKPPEVILQQQKNRAGLVYELSTLQRMQEIEIAYSEELSQALDIPLIIIKDQAPTVVINQIKQQIK